MSVIADFVEDVGGGIVDTVSDVVSSVGGAVSDVVNFVVDEVIDPVATTVGNVVESALDDPLKTIAEIGAAVYAPWAIPLIEGADVAIAGGDLSDVLEATAKAYVTQQVGQYAGEVAGKYAGEAATKAGGALAENAKLISSVVTAGTGGAAIAVVTGQDPMRAFLTGGISAGVPALLGKVDGFASFSKSNPVAARVISAAVTSSLTGANPTTAMVNAAIAASGIVQDVIKQFDPENGTPNAKLNAAQTAIATDILMGTTSAAITGGNPSNVVRAALMKAGSKALGDMVSSGFKSTTDSTTAAYKQVSDSAAGIESNESAQKEASDNYNNLADQLRIRIDTQNGLVQAANDAIAKYNTTKTRGDYDAAIAAKQAADSYVTELNKDYATTFKPQLDKYSGQLSSLQADHNDLVSTYTSAMDGLQNSVTSLSGSLNDAYDTTNKEVVEAMNPDFDADAYRKLNGLGADVNAYDHYLYEGQYKGLPINSEDAKALSNGAATGAAVDKASGSIDPANVFDGKSYASTAAAQKAAAAMGMSYFTAPDGNTYKMLSDTEVKDKIKSASSFGEAFTLARKTLGAGASFEWTNPDTGKTSSFTTQTKEEAASSSNAGSLVRVTSDVTDYVTNKIVGNISDYKNFNPADLSGDEYKKYINAYLNATDSQRQQMLKGAESSTFNVIANVLKEAPQMIRQGANAPAFVTATGELKAADYTNYLQVIKTGVNTAAADIAGVGVRGLQVLGKAIGADTSTLNSIQDLLTNQKDTDMSKLVGNEKVIAGGFASSIESAGAFLAGGPIASIMSLGAIAANNAWIEGGSAGIDSKGNSWSSEADARANGVFEYRKLTTQENAMRTAIMTSLEIVGESFGVPGLHKVMQGVPIGQGVDALIAGIKRSAAGMVNEQVSELATTAAQMAADQFTSFGLQQNATWSDYVQALQDTALATAVAVGTSGSIATATRNMRTAANIVRDESSASVTPLTYNTVVATDANGKGVTLVELLTANSVADFSNPTANADIAKLTPTVDLRSVVNLGDMSVTLGDILGGAQSIASTTDVLSASAVAEIFRESGLSPNDAAIQQFVGQDATSSVFNNISAYVNTTKATAQDYVNRATQDGISMTDTQAQQYVQEGLDINAALNRAGYETLASKVGTLATKDDIDKIVSGMQLSAGISKDDVTAAISDYMKANPGITLGDVATQVSEATKNLATTEDTKTAIADALKGYATTKDIKDAIANIQFPAGLSKDDVANAISDYMKANPGVSIDQVAAKITEATKNLATTEDTKTAIADALKGYATTKDITNATDTLKTALAEAQKGNTDKFNDIDNAIKALKDAGLTTDQVQQIVDTASSGLSDTFKTALSDAVKGNADALADVKSGLESKISDVQKTLEGALGDQADAFNAKVKDLMDQGKTYQEATSQALADIGVQITDLGADFATKLKDTSDALSGQVTDLAADTQAKYDSLTEAQKALADQLTQQGDTLEAAIAKVQQQTQEQITGLAADTQAKYDSLTEAQKALADQLTQQGDTLENAIAKVQQQTQEQITGLKEDTQAKYDALTEAQKALADQLTQQGETLENAITKAQQETQEQITKSQEQTQEQITGLSQDLQTKYNTLTQNQKDLADQLTQQGLDFDTAITLASRQTAEGFENVYGQMASNQEATQKAIADAAAATQAKAAQEAEKTRAAAAQNAANQAKLGNINTLMGMLSNASDASGQQVTVKAADPAKIGYIYDWSSIFANPSQEKMFASPYGGYAEGGVVRSEMDDVNDELLKILKG